MNTKLKTLIAGGVGAAVVGGAVMLGGGAVEAQRIIEVNGEKRIEATVPSKTVEYIRWGLQADYGEGKLVSVRLSLQGGENDKHITLQNEALDRPLVGDENKTARELVEQLTDLLIQETIDE